MNAPGNAASDVDVVARRPAVLAAGCFALGIFSHRIAPAAPAVWLSVLALLVGATWFVRDRRVGSCLIAVSLLVAGLAGAQLSAFYYPRDHVSAFAGDAPRLAELELHIDHPPRTLTGPPFGAHSVPPKQVATATVRALKTRSGWRPACGQVLVQISEPHPRLDVNQTVRVTGMLQRPAPAMNPGQFDWAAYYREQGILNSVHVSHADNIRILSSPGPDWIDSLRASVRGLLATGFSGRDEVNHALLRALLLGDHDPQLRDVQEQFKRTGTGHHLAISGMHVAVLGGFVFAVCRLLCLSPRWSAWLMIGFVVVYGVVALPSPPVVRSVVLCVMFGLGVVLRRSTDALQLLALSVLAMLVYHPLDLYNPGFQLSFGTVLGLILFTRPMLRGLRRDPDALPFPAGRQKPSLLATATSSFDRMLVHTIAAGLVAWGVSMPLIAFHFEQLNPWAVVAGIVLAPIVMAALVGGLLKVLLSLLWPGLSGTWAAMAGLPVGWMRTVVDWLAALPGGDVPVPPPPVLLILGFYGLLLPMLWPCHRAGLRLCLRGSRVLVLLLIVALPFQVGFTARGAGAGTTRVTLLSVGAGQCAVVEPPSGRTVVIDAGSTGMTDLIARCLGPYLRHRRCTSVDTVAISHPDYDHFSGVAEVVHAYGVREVLTSAHFAEQARRSPAAESLLETLADAHRPPRLVARGQVIPLGRDTALEVLWPPADAQARAAQNDESLVLKLTHAGRSILFTGDVQDAAMAGLLREPARLRADVLVAPHHGSCERLTAEFVRAVSPTYIVSSNDRSLTSKQREFDRVAAAALAADHPLLRTHRRGAITVTFDPSGRLAVQTAMPAPASAKP
jgi:competence protein ComEC